MQANWWLLLSLAIAGSLVAASEDTDQILADWLQHAYYKLEFTSGLNDRCPVYARIAQLVNGTSGGQDYEAPVDQMISETSERIEKTGKLTSVFQPDEQTRGQFISVAHSLDPLEVDPMVWLDMFYCISEWVELDERARNFVKSSPDA